MNWLFWSILFSTGLFLIFKFAALKKVHVLPTIVVNYFTCFITGNLLPGHNHVFHSEYLQSPWFWPIASMGILFITGFYSMGTGTRLAGAAAASVAAKMSVIVPAVVAIWLFAEALDGLQYVGIAVSLFSVFLMVEPAENNNRIHKGMGILLLVFLASGAVDTGLNLVSHAYSEMVDPYTTSTIMFGVAGLLGAILFFFTRDNHQFRWQEIVAGIILGWVNFASLISIFKGIEHFHGRTAWFFAVNNIGVVALSALLAAVFFKERIHRSGYWGLALAVVAILLMNSNAFF